MDIYLKSYLHIWIVNICLLVDVPKVSGHYSQGNVIEYCQGEMFSPRCNDGEVINVVTARYGHIQLGRCLDTDFGHLGCEKNELTYLDKECSGKSECDIVIGDTILGKDLPCSSSLLRYLEASFVCIKVYQTDTTTCTTSIKIPVMSRIRYLNSQTTLTSGCGEDSNPWILEAKPGQQINISMIDFSWKATKPQHTCAVRYGYMIDVTENTVVDICGGTDRNKHVYLSKGSELQVVIDRHLLSDVSFVLSYQGCPTFTSPKDSWIKDANGVITVGCHHNTRQWKMRCIGNNWIGLVGDCTQVAKKTEVVEKTEESDTVLGMPPVVTFSLVGSIFFIVLCVTITFIVGIFCIRKPKQVKNDYYLSQQASNNQTLRSFPFSTMRPVERQLLVHTDGPQQQNSTNTGDVPSAQYFVLENRSDTQNEPIYDAVYQNINQ